MNTQKAVALGYRPCPVCKGEGREWHGSVDATCMGCKNTELMLCPSCRRDYVRQGHEECAYCEGARPAA